MNKTTWEDWYATDAAALDDLLSRCSSVFVFGLSMGGTLTLKLAQEYGDRIAGIGLVNASVITERKDYKYLLPIAKYFLRGKKGLGNDIAKPDTSEGSYGMTPIKATVSLGKLWPIVRRDLPKVTQPALIMRSAVDHVVEPVNFDIIIQGISSSDVTAEILPNSFHVATLDYDAPRIFELSTAFARRIHDSVKGPSHAK
jgi:carboxylesterase